MSELVKSWDEPLSTQSDQLATNEVGDLNIRDALRLARKDQKFRTVFLANPEVLDEVFLLSESQIENVRSLGESCPTPEQALTKLENEYPAPQAEEGGN